MWRIVGVLLLALPAPAGEGKVALPVDDEVSQALALARKHVRSGAWNQARAILEDIARGDSEAVHSEDEVLYYPVREVARRRALRLLFLEPARGGLAVQAPPRPIPPDLPETLPREPFWSFGLAERDARLSAAYGVWIVRAHDREPSVAVEPPDQTELGAYPTVRPMVSEGVVLYRDYVEMVARFLGSGAMAYFQARYDIPDRLGDPQYLYPVNKVRPGMVGHASDAKKRQRVYSYFDYGGNTIAVGEGLVAVVEQRRVPNELLTSQPFPPRPNLLVAYSRAHGKTIWAWHMDWCSLSVRRDKDVYAAWRRDYARHPKPTFYGPGVIADGLLYTVAQEGQEVSLWAFDVRDGQVRFRTLLHFADQTPGRLPRGTAVAVGDGAVFVVTQAGVVAAVDARPPGRLRWLRRYAREIRVDEREGEKAIRIRQTFAYQEPLVADGKLIVAAADAQELLALDTWTGRLDWAQPLAPLGRVYHVVGLGANRLVLAGHDVLALDVGTGEKAWGPVPLASKPHGCGFVGRRYVHVPTRRREEARSLVERFDLATGKRAAPLLFDVARLGNLLSVGGRLIAANDDRVMCFTTCDAELARIDARIQAEGSRPHLWWERAQLSLAARPPRRAAARRDFRIALEAAGREEGDDRMMRAHALANLIAIVRESGDRSALDEARAVARSLRKRMLPGEAPPHPYEAQIALLELSLLPAGEARRQATAAFLDRYGETKVVVNDRVVLGSAAVK